MKNKIERIARSHLVLDVELDNEEVLNIQAG